MRIIFAAIAVILLPGFPVLAQGTVPQDLENDPAVQRNQGANPTEQGNRAPTETRTDTNQEELQALLDKVWLTPVDLQGNPIARADGTLAAPSPAAATAQGCGAAASELAARAAGSGTPCPPGGPSTPVAAPK